MSDRRNVLAVGGSDSAACSGIQADLRTLTALGLHASTVITAVTAQNTRHVAAVDKLSASVVRSQLEAILQDLPPAAVKIGMVGSCDACGVLAEGLRSHSKVPVVLDPVLSSSSGTALADDAVVAAMVNELFPLTRVLTPNRDEVERLAGQRVRNRRDAEQAASRLREMGACYVVIKGGHQAGDRSVDWVLGPDGVCSALEATRIQTDNTRGTGCTFSSAIAGYLALGHSELDSVRLAKSFTHRAIQRGYSIGSGPGPVSVERLKL